MNKSMLIILLILGARSGFCLTENSKVSVLTSEPGSELYTLFGHTAIRINDSSIGIDKVYNFGTFDFSSPFFYARFLKGNLDYFLSVNDYPGFIHNSQLEGRRVYEQILNLNFSEKSNLFYNLERQYNSDDRFYNYDFFYDNCATRVRDAIIKVHTKPFLYDTASFCCITFRQLLIPYISQNFWIDFSVNIALGKNADKIASPNDFMFLPHYLMKILKDSKIANDKTLIVNVPDSSYRRFNLSYISGWTIAIVLVFLTLIDKFRRIIFYSFVSTTGLIGLLLLIVSLVSDNTAYSNNLNIAWTIPSLAIISVRNRKISNVLNLIYLSLLFILISSWNILPQAFSNTFLPWILTLIIILLMDMGLFVPIHANIKYRFKSTHKISVE
jgi:hypothetical protein